MTASTEKNAQKADQRNHVDARGWGRWRRLRAPSAKTTMAAAAWFTFFVVGGASLAQAQSYSVLYSFKGYPGDGTNPSAGLVRDASGNLYGTTPSGGSSNDGTVFKVDPSGNETILYNFMGGTDGGFPYAGLVLGASGNLYGTTLTGGSSGNGTVFKMDPSGNEIVLHSFTGGTDGSLPMAGLVMDASGNLYGTTDAGGASNDGIVFKVDPSGNEVVLHTFAFSDGAHPEAGLVLDDSGNLYGTTRDGGAASDGTVFKVDRSGNETVLHSFTGSDGANPEAGLAMDRPGNLYGTTEVGGSSGNCSGGCGTVFKLDPLGKETVLHSFANSDGALPYAGLVMDRSGNLFGTTQAGGTAGDGTVFKVDRWGNESVLHSFAGGDSDGAVPYGAGVILDQSGNLYGATEIGGSSGDGTVFMLGPGRPF